MTTGVYDSVMGQARRLTLTDQLRLLEELAALVRRRVTTQARSILELQGLGKEIWQGIDAQEYVEQERAAWRG